MTFAHPGRKSISALLIAALIFAPVAEVQAGCFDDAKTAIRSVENKVQSSFENSKDAVYRFMKGFYLQSQAPKTLPHLLNFKWEIYWEKLREYGDLFKQAKADVNWVSPHLLQPQRNEELAALFEVLEREFNQGSIGDWFDLLGQQSILAEWKKPPKFKGKYFETRELLKRAFIAVRKTPLEWRSPYFLERLSSKIPKWFQKRFGNWISVEALEKRNYEKLMFDVIDLPTMLDFMVGRGMIQKPGFRDALSEATDSVAPQIAAIQKVAGIAATIFLTVKLKSFFPLALGGAKRRPSEIILGPFARYEVERAIVARPGSAEHLAFKKKLRYAAELDKADAEYTRIYALLFSFVVFSALYEHRDQIEKFGQKIWKDPMLIPNFFMKTLPLYAKSTWSLLTMTPESQKIYELTHYNSADVIEEQMDGWREAQIEEGLELWVEDFKEVNHREPTEQEIKEVDRSRFLPSAQDEQDEKESLVEFEASGGFKSDELKMLDAWRAEFEQKNGRPPNEAENKLKIRLIVHPGAKKGIPGYQSPSDKIPSPK